jgi:peroxiredoxin
MAVMMPPAVVLASAPVKVAQGEAKVHVLELLPFPETQVCAMVVAEMEAVQKRTAAEASAMLRIFMEVSFPWLIIAGEWFELSKCH